MITKQEFKNIFESRFSKEQKQFEKTKKIATLWVAASTVVVAACAVLYHYFLDKSGDHILLNILIAIFAWFGLAMLPIMSIKDRQMSKLKKIELREILRMIYEGNVTYDNAAYVNHKYLDLSRFCNKDYNKYSGEDYFSVEINRETPKGQVSTTLEVSDIKAENVSVVDGKRESKVVFKGAVAAIKFKQPFGCRLCLNCANTFGLEPVETESSDFNKIFSPKTDNQVQSRLILSVTMMQTLLDFQHKAKCKIRLSFCDNYLFVSFDRNLFEFSKKDDEFNFELVEPIYDDIALFDALVSDVANNRKIFRI